MAYQTRRDPLFDQTMAAALEKRGRELIGIGLLVAGQILVERIFAYNGMGKLIYDAILNQDFPVEAFIIYIYIDHLILTPSVQLTKN